jgi:hypothetical protein
LLYFLIILEFMKENGFKQITMQFCLKLMTMNIHLITMTGLLLCFQVVHSQTDDLETGKDSITRSTKTKKYKPYVSGFVQVHFLEPFNTNGDSIVDPDRFRVLRARVSVDGKINKYVSYVVEIDPRSPEITGILRDAYISVKIIPDHTIRIGQQKTQFGYENRESSTRLYVVNRSEMSDNLSRGYNLRDIGIGLLGKLNINEQFRFEDAFTLVNGSGMNVPGIEDFNRKKNLWGRMGIRYKAKDLMWRFGISGGMGDQKDLGEDPVNPSDDFIIDFKRFGLDAEIDHKWFFMASEYAAGTDIVSDTISNPFGYYVLLAGKTKWKAGPLVRYDVLEDEWKRWTLGAYYGLPNDRIRVLLNYEFRGYHSDEVLYGEDDRLYIQLQIRF